MFRTHGILRVVREVLSQTVKRVIPERTGAMEKSGKEVRSTDSREARIA
jgi:hypothetical protein